MSSTKCLPTRFASSLPPRFRCVCALKLILSCCNTLLHSHLDAVCIGWLPAAHVFLMESCGADIMSTIFDCTYSNNLDQGFVGVETGRGLQGWGNLQMTDFW